MCVCVFAGLLNCGRTSLVLGASVPRHFIDVQCGWVVDLNLETWVPNSDCATRCAGPLGKLLLGLQSASTTARRGERT